MKDEKPLYGNRRIDKMYRQIDDLRKAIRAEGTDAIQSAWDKVEEHVDFLYKDVLREFKFIPARILNETEDAYLITQQLYGSRGGVWLPKSEVTVINRNQILSHHQIKISKSLAKQRGLSDIMS